MVMNRGPNGTRAAGEGRPGARRVRPAVRRAKKFLNQMVDNGRTVNILNHMVIDRSPRLDRMFHALSHPARRTMLRTLAAGTPRNLTELARPLRMSFPAASKHVRVLERARLVRRRRVGRTHVCRIEARPLAEAERWLETYRRVWEGQFNRLDDLLDELKSAETKSTDTRSSEGEPR